MTPLSLEVMKDTFAVCRLSQSEPFPGWASKSRFYSITKTLDEISVVCTDADVPANVKAEKAWKCLKVKGPLDFSLVGILSSISTVLAQAGVSIFAVSTYETDYLLVKTEMLEKAKTALITAGHQVHDSSD